MMLHRKADHPRHRQFSLVKFELMDPTMNSQDVDTEESGQRAKAICIILSLLSSRD